MSSTDPILALRVAEAKAIKKDRDKKAAERQQTERAEVQRARAERIAAGLLGRCHSCGQEVDTAEGIVLRHISDVDALEPNECEGTGEPMQWIAAHRDR